MSNINVGVQIFLQVLQHGQLDIDSDLAIEISKSEVQEEISELANLMDFKVIKMNSTIYRIPKFESSVQVLKGKRNMDWLASTASKSEFYLSEYIKIFLLYKFYGGKNTNTKKCKIIKIKTLLDGLDERLADILNGDQLKLMGNKEEQLKLNLCSIAEAWDQKSAHEENTQTTKYGTVLRICDFLEHEKVIQLTEDKKEIRTTKKLDDYMTDFFLNDSCMSDINNIFVEDATR